MPQRVFLPRTVTPQIIATVLANRWLDANPGAARSLAPPDLVIGLLELRFLTKVQHRQQDEPHCRYSQQERLNAV